MIIPNSRVDNALCVHLQRIYKAQPTGSVERPAKQDAVSISRFSELVERGRAAAMAQPDVREDRVQQVRAAMENGESPDASDVAASVINSTLEGQVEGQ